MLHIQLSVSYKCDLNRLSCDDSDRLKLSGKTGLFDVVVLIHLRNTKDYYDFFYLLWESHETWIFHHRHLHKQKKRANSSDMRFRDIRMWMCATVSHFTSNLQHARPRCFITECLLTFVASIWGSNDRREDGLEQIELFSKFPHFYRVNINEIFQ